MEQARISNHQGTHAAHAARGKPAVPGKDSLADAQGDAAAGGFMALLAALGDGGLQDTLTPQATVEEPFSSTPVSMDASAETALAGDLLSWQWQATITGGAAQGSPGQGGRGHDSMGAPGVTGPGLNLPGFAGQGLMAVPVAGSAIGAGALAETAAPLIPFDGPLPEGSLRLQTALQDGAVTGDGLEHAAEMPGAAGVAGKRKVPGRLGGGASQVGDVSLATGAQGSGLMGAKGQGASSVQGAAPFQPLLVERRDVAGLAREGARPLEQGLDGVPTALAQWASDVTAGTRVVARGIESGANVSGAGGTAESIQDRPLGLAGEVAADGVNPAMAGAEDAVTEQVAYWVHQNIQNARLTVTHDGQPVEVHVSLTGNEAHVSFGSDEAQTRDLIDGSVAQLRDMLRQEGLVLSGMTVGESGRRQGHEGTGSGGEKNNAQKQARVVVPTTAERPAQRVHVLGDRAVDIFV